MYDKFPKLDKVAVIIPAYCNNGARMFGIRTEQVGHRRWLQTWAFPIDEDMARREQIVNQKIQGELNFAPAYSGCPYCGATGWIECGKCHNIICWDGKSQSGQCPKCGKKYDSVTELKDWDLEAGEH